VSVRQTHIIEDCERCFEALFNAKISGGVPWSRWETYLGFPEEDVLSQLEKPVIYTESPKYIEEIKQQGGLGLGLYQMYFGAWDDRKTGGPEEINIISSYILQLFRNTKTLHTTTFSVTLGGTSYSGKTLTDMGIVVQGIRDTGEKATEDIKEFRHEYEIMFMA